MRGPSRHALRFAPSLKTLVQNILASDSDANVDEDTLEFLCELAGRTLEANRYTGISVDTRNVDKRINGLVEKYQIVGHDTLARALIATHGRLTANGTAGEGQKDSARFALLADYMHFLLLLADQPEPKTDEAAAVMLYDLHNPPEKRQELTWDVILAEEPFEGQHWEMPPSPSSISSVELWPDRHRRKGSMPESTSSSSSSSQNEHDLLHSEIRKPSEGGDGAHLGLQDELLRGRESIEKLGAQRYWQNKQPPNELEYLSTRLRDNPAFGRIAIGLSRDRHPSESTREIVLITEVQALREVLAAMTGRLNCVLVKNSHHGDYEVASPCPLIAHMSTTALSSILKAFGRTATVLDRLRSFIDGARDINHRTTLPYTSRSCLTLAAFVDGIERLIWSFEQWCSGLEDDILRTMKPSHAGSPLVISLIKLQRGVDARNSSAFYVMWKIICDLRLGWPISTVSSAQAFVEPAHRDPCVISTAILDQLVGHMNFHARMGNQITTMAAFTVFQAAAQPMWSLLSSWLKDGTSSIHQGRRNWTCLEFFIAQPGTAPSIDDWQEAAILRRHDDGKLLVPHFLAPLGEALLSAGKSVGLLRAIGVDDFFYEQKPPWMASWPALHELLANRGHFDPKIDFQQVSTPSFPAKTFSKNDITATLADFILPICQIPEARLTKVLIEDCALFQHLDQLRGLFLMGWGDVMASFCRILFERMDSRKPWADYHYLNSVLRDVIAFSRKGDFDMSMARLSFRGDAPPDKSITMKLLAGISPEYRAPFPIHYLINTAAMRMYGSIYVFLLQIHRAKSVVDGMTLKRITDRSISGELKAFYSLRGQLTWFLNVILNHIMNYVISVEVRRLDDQLRRLQSLDQMIKVHHTFLTSVLTACLLNEEHTSLHDIIMLILDIPQALSSLFDALTTNQAGDITQPSLVILKERFPAGRRLKKRLRESQLRLRRNVIGFTDDLAAGSDEESDSDSDDHLDHSAHHVPSETISLTEESFLDRVESLSQQLDKLVRHLQRAVEHISHESNLSIDADSPLSILSFSLQDWDR